MEKGEQRVIYIEWRRGYTHGHSSVCLSVCQFPFRCLLPLVGKNDFNRRAAAQAQVGQVAKVCELAKTAKTGSQVCRGRNRRDYAKVRRRSVSSSVGKTGSICGIVRIAYESIAKADILELEHAWA